jgi:hypothetical protein
MGVPPMLEYVIEVTTKSTKENACPAILIAGK